MPAFDIDAVSDASNEDMFAVDAAEIRADSDAVNDDSSAARKLDDDPDVKGEYGSTCEADGA